MKTKNYIIGLAGLMLCTACSNEELTRQTTRTDEVLFGATIQTATAISSRSIGDNKHETEALPYIYGIHIRKIQEGITPVNNSQYEVLNGNKGTLTLPENSTDPALIWTSNEKTNNTEITFYAWTQPDGVTLDSKGEGTTTGTIDFGDTAGNRAPKSADKEDIKHKMNDAYYTPLELFMSAVATGSYKDNPSISLPFTHPVAKVRMEVYNWDNEQISNFIKIQFPFINQTYTIEQKEGQAFAITNPTNTATPLELDFTKLYASSNQRFFYLPPIDFAQAGDFIITYNGDRYYGTLNALSVKKLDAGDYMTCRIDLNKNYGTGVGATINNWSNKIDNAYSNPYQGIYTEDDLKVLKECLANGTALPESLYITEKGKKIIRLYNDLTLSDEEWSLILEQDMIFDGLGHIVTVPSGKSLFGDITATGVEINNIRLAGAGQLATSLTNVKVYNCHANGSRDLIGEAKNNTIFDFCSAETASNKLANITSGTVTMQNSFVAYADAAEFAGGTIAKNSFIFDTTINEGTYYDSTGQKETNKITVDSKTGRLVIINALQNPEKIDELIDLLNAASNTLNHTASQKYWVYVYGKTYPVMRIK